MEGFSNTFIEAYQKGKQTPPDMKNISEGEDEFNNMRGFDFSKEYDRKTSQTYLLQQSIMDIANSPNNKGKNIGVYRTDFDLDFNSVNSNLYDNLNDDSNAKIVIEDMMNNGFVKNKNNLIAAGVLDEDGYPSNALVNKVKENYLKYHNSGGFYVPINHEFIIPKKDLDSYLSNNNINKDKDTTLTLNKETGTYNSNKKRATPYDYIVENNLLNKDELASKKTESVYVKDRNSWKDYAGSLGMYEDVARTASTVTAFTPASSLSGILDYGALGLRVADEWNDPRYTNMDKASNYLTDFGFATIGLLPYGKLARKLIKGEKTANALVKAGKFIQWGSAVSGGAGTIMTVSDIVNHWNTEGITVDDARNLMYSLTALGSAGYAKFSNVSRASKNLTKLDKELGYSVKSWDSEGFKNAARKNFSGSELNKKLKQIDNNFSSIDKWRNSKATKSWYNFNKSKEFGPTGRPLIKGNDDDWTTLVKPTIPTGGFTRTLSKKTIVKPLTYSPPKEFKVTIPEGSRVNRLTKKVKGADGKKIRENRSPVNRISNETYLPLLHGWGNIAGGAISEFDKGAQGNSAVTNSSNITQGVSSNIIYERANDEADKSFIDIEYKKGKDYTPYSFESNGKLYKGVTYKNNKGVTNVKYYEIGMDDKSLNSINQKYHHKINNYSFGNNIDMVGKELIGRENGGILDKAIIAGQNGMPMDLYKFNSNINNRLDYSGGSDYPFIKNDKGEFVFNTDYNKKQNGFNTDFNIDNNFNTIATDNNGNPISLDFYKQNANNGNPAFIRNNDGTFTLNPNYNQAKTGFSTDFDVKLDTYNKPKMAIPTEEYSKKPDKEKETNPYSGQQLPYKKGTLTEDIGLYAGSYLLGELITGSGKKEKDIIENAHNRYLNGDYDVIRKPLVYSPKFIRTASGLSHEYKTTALNNIMQNIKSNKTSDIKLNMVSDKMNQLQMNQAESNLNAKDYEAFKQDRVREETEYANESAKENAIVNQNIQMENAANVADKQMKSKSDMMYDQSMLDFYTKRKAETQSFMKGMRDIIYNNNHDNFRNNYNDTVNNYNNNIAIKEEKFNNLSEPLKQEYYKLYTELTSKNNNLTEEEIANKTNRIKEIIG